MIKQTNIAIVLSTLAAGVVLAGTAAATPLVNRPIAREAGEIRGEGKGHPAIEIKEQLARHGADDKQPDDRGGRRHGPDGLNQLARHGADDPTEDIGDDHGGGRHGAGAPSQLARHGADDKQPDDRGGRRHSPDGLNQLARHGADDPTEDIGDDHGGRRG